MEMAKVESVSIKVLLVIVGFMLGIGTAHLTTMNKVAEHAIKIKMIEKTNEETLALVRQVVNQNNLLIQKIIVEP